MLKDAQLDEKEREEIKELLNPEKDDKNFKEVNSLKDIESVLKESGFSNTEAKTLISKVKEFSRDEKEQSLRDAEQDLVTNLQNFLKQIK